MEQLITVIFTHWQRKDQGAPVNLGSAQNPEDTGPELQLMSS